jgi:4-aminobutyrate aminotransferase/(S)-3-amino-2-methylpropionate transaminase
MNEAHQISHSATAGTTRSAEVLALEAAHVAAAARPPMGLVWDRAAGAEIFDVDGNRYVDFTSGVLVTNTGHCHPRVVKAIQDQAERLLNCYAAPHPLRAELGRRLTELFPDPLKSVVFTTTGSEAVEAAVRIARHATGRSEILGFQGSFHGRTAISTAIGGLGAVKQGAGPLAASILHAPFPYPYRCEFRPFVGDHDCSDHTLAAVERVLETESTGGVAAIVFEPYQGSAGSLVASPAFAKGLRELCDRRGILLVVDEVQSGFARTGTLFAFEQLQIVPDLVVLGKGMASGVPMSAVIGSAELLDRSPPGSMSSTFGGNPLACAAALATIDVVLEENLSDRAATLGASLFSGLERLAVDSPLIGEVRGMGLALGIELVRDRETREPASLEARAIVETAVAGGLALIPPIGLHGNVIRIAPPLTISDELAEEGLAILANSVVGAG